MSIRTFFRVALGLLAWLPLARAAESPASPDSAWQAYEAARNALPIKPYAEMSVLERQQWIEQQALQLRELGLAFIERNPTDPRRWTVVLGLSADSPRFVKVWGTTNADGELVNTVIDTAAATAWKTQVAALRGALAAAPDVPAEVRQDYVVQEALRAFFEAGQAERRGEAVDLAALRKRLVDVAARYPDEPAAQSMLYYFISLVAKLTPDREEAEWQGFVDSPNGKVAEMAKGKVGFFALKKRPIAITFTAVDGRPVDIVRLRGKVVLVDFWATWCRPCVAELPNVKKVYAAYHDKGFEIVGIALENAKLVAGDTPEQTTAKLEKAKQALLEFTQKNAMPWPQYFDGKFWKNEISTRYAIGAIPAMFLLDQNGMLVSTDARGEKLEQTVKRLLNL